MISVLNGKFAFCLFPLYHPRNGLKTPFLNEEAQYFFIELQDVGYPGSTYNLMYRPQQDILAGFYFQAAVKQTFEVVFSRAE